MTFFPCLLLFTASALCSAEALAILEAATLVDVQREAQGGVQKKAQGTAQKKVQGVSEDEIVFGQSAALTGPAGELGVHMRQGLLAAFAEANRQGGVHSRKLSLITRDDSYEPEKAIENVHALINEDKVFSLIGGVGTSTSRAVVPIVAKTPLLYIGPFTGASYLRSSALENVINVRSSYKQELYKILTHLKNDLGVSRVSVFYQNDSYGEDGLQGAREIVKSLRGVQIVSLGSYVRNTTAVKTALLDILKGNPQAVIMIGAYLPTATFIKWAEKINIGASVYLSVSFVGVSALANELKGSRANVFVSQVVPFPFSENGHLSRKYQRAMTAIGGNERGYVTFEGYIVGRLVVEALNRVGRALDHRSFLKVFAEKEFNIDGFRLNYGPEDNQGSTQVFLTRVSRQQVMPVTNLMNVAQ